MASPSVDDDHLVAEMKTHVAEILDFPIPGIHFKDIAPLLAKPKMLHRAVAAVEDAFQGVQCDAILAVDARGFVLGAALADRMHAGFVMVRKPGKLPGKVDSFGYECEYCSGSLEITSGVVEPGLSCLIVDDLLATGGTARATADYVLQRGASVAGFAFLVELLALQGRRRLMEGPVVSVLTF
jgi:adenine phosphoribosyltransferase